MKCNHEQCLVGNKGQIMSKYKHCQICLTKKGIFLQFQGMIGSFLSLFWRNVCYFCIEMRHTRHLNFIQRYREILVTLVHIVGVVNDIG